MLYHKVLNAISTDLGIDAKALIRLTDLMLHSNPKDTKFCREDFDQQQSRSKVLFFINIPTLEPIEYDKASS